MRSFITKIDRTQQVSLLQLSSEILRYQREPEVIGTGNFIEQADHVIVNRVSRQFMDPCAQLVGLVQDERIAPDRTFQVIGQVQELRSEHIEFRKGSARVCLVV